MTAGGPPITAREVGKWFKSSFKRGPWPAEAACAALAARLELERRALAEGPIKLPSSPDNLAAKTAQELLKGLGERERYWRTMREQQSAAAPLTAIFMPDAEAAIADLRAALHRAMPALDFPPAFVARRRRNAWTGTAFLVAVLALQAWRKAGGGEVSLDYRGPLVRFVVTALDRLGVKAPAGGDTPKDAAVASALQRIPAMAWHLQQ